MNSVCPARNTLGLCDDLHTAGDDHADPAPPSPLKGRDTPMSLMDVKTEAIPVVDGRRSMKRKVFGFIPVPVAVILGLLGLGGAAWAAIVLLTTNIHGTAHVITTGTSNELTVTPSAQNGSALNCNDISLPAPYTDLTFNPTLTKVINGGNSNATTPVDGGTCTITLSVHNTGTTAIRVDQSSGFTVPTVGWAITDLSGDALTQSIAPGASKDMHATLTANNAAVEGGTFGGKLVFTDGS